MEQGTFFHNLTLVIFTSASTTLVLAIVAIPGRLGSGIIADNVHTIVEAPAPLCAGRLRARPGRGAVRRTDRNVKTGGA
jgi:hypothetical protein